RLSTVISPALITRETPHGHFDDSGHEFPQNNSEGERKAVIRIYLKALPAVTITGTLARTTPAPGGGGTTPTTSTGNPPRPPAPPNDMPPAIKQLGVRVKYDFDNLSLLEFHGKIDFE